MVLIASELITQVAHQFPAFSRIRPQRVDDCNSDCIISGSKSVNGFSAFEEYSCLLEGCQNIASWRMFKSRCSLNCPLYLPTYRSSGHTRRDCGTENQNGRCIPFANGSPPYIALMGTSERGTRARCLRRFKHPLG